MKIGYVYSTSKTTIDSQIDILKKDGTDHIFYPKEYTKMVNSLKSGDTLIIKSLQSLQKTTKELVKMVELLTKKEVEIKSIEDNLYINHLTANMLLIFFKAGRENRIAEHNLKTIRTIEEAQHMWAGGKHKKKEIAQKLGIARPTLYKYLKMELPDLI